MQQYAGSLRIYGAYAKATLASSGAVANVIDRLVADAQISEPRLTSTEALRIAMRHHGYDGASSLAIASQAQHVDTFETTEELFEAPSVERVGFASQSGAITGGFLVETWGVTSNRLHYTLVSDDGQVISSELRTSSDRYRVFTEDPSKGAQEIVSGPAPGGIESPDGWLGSGSQNTIGITGNNVAAYLDAKPNNMPDRGGAPVTNGDFLASYEFGVEPSTENNRAVAVQNLFYLNNVIHDQLYRHGFNEAAGNFQSDNFGRGGSASDAVNAEAQDGSGTDNANFATPADGRKPRMQMYLWHGAGPTHEVEINAPTSLAGVFDAKGAEFGATLTTDGLSGEVVLYKDPTEPSTDACEATTQDLTGKIALVDRGTCAFTQKALNAQKAGAKAVIVANTDASGAVFQMGGEENQVRIPAVMVNLADGEKLRSTSGINATERIKAVQPLMVDGDIDSDVVFHEYGHGLTWRMVGNMSGKLAGAIGEGASDVVAFMMNGDDRIGEFSASNAVGIRRAPYAGYPRTYKDVAGEIVHDDGEIYAAAMWRLKELFMANGINESLLWDYFIDGMNYTPATPAFENMRDGMLQAASARGGTAHRCYIWQAFAQFGIGAGAKGVATDTGVTITESFALPTECQ